MKQVVIAPFVNSAITISLMSSKDLGNILISSSSLTFAISSSLIIRLDAIFAKNIANVSSTLYINDIPNATHIAKPYFAILFIFLYYLLIITYNTFNLTTLFQNINISLIVTPNKLSIIFTEAFIKIVLSTL